MAVSTGSGIIASADASISRTLAKNKKQEQEQSKTSTKSVHVDHHTAAKNKDRHFAFYAGNKKWSGGRQLQPCRNSGRGCPGHLAAGFVHGGRGGDGHVPGAPIGG